jgi:hypothetical protein
MASAPPVSKLFLPPSIAAWVLSITTPFKSVLPATLTSKPPSPALMPYCTAGLMKRPSALTPAALPPTVAMMPVQMGGMHKLTFKPELLCRDSPTL